MHEITLADHADYPVVLIDHRDRADAALGQQSCDCRYGRILVDRDNFARHDIDGVHPIAPDRLGKQQNTALPASCTGPDQLTRAIAASSRQTVRVQKARSASRRTESAKFPIARLAAVHAK
jgi:hypothetical protein